MLGLRRYQQTQVDLWQGDITDFAVDAMTNAAIPDLQGSSEVATAIHRAGGPEMASVLEAAAPVQGGTCVVTGPGRLPCHHVIHPAWGSAEALGEDMLRMCYQSILKTANLVTARHLSIPALPLTACGLPLVKAAEIAMSTTKHYLDTMPLGSLRRITFVAHDASTYEALQSQLFATFPDELDEFEA
jgi:O-acetyl-ADP-ribose deacetylase (regulator of RNase III)